LKIIKKKWKEKEKNNLNEKKHIIIIPFFTFWVLKKHKDLKIFKLFGKI